LSFDIRDGEVAEQGHIKGLVKNAEGSVEIDDFKFVTKSICGMMQLCAIALSSRHFGAGVS
jgi:hypothetical protein